VGAFLFRLVGPPLVVRVVLRSIVHDPACVTPDQVRGYAEPLRSEEAVRALIHSARQIVPSNLPALTRRYPEIEAPTLVMWGRQDRVVPLSVGQRLADAMPNARLHVLEECGHLPMEEWPDESFAVLAGFLNDTAEGPSVKDPGRIRT
jgi:pimeloyl-ACP methyl ester carboxylesterase